MILIGQYDSPFVRRVGIALRLYDIDFEHRPWSTFRDAEKIAPFNPLTRVPTLVLDGGEALVESASILDYLDELVGPERALIGPEGAERRRTLRLCALATGMADKAVSLFYERVLHKEQSETWVARCVRQISATLDVLESEMAAASSQARFGERISHADIAIACVLRFVGEAHAGRFPLAARPALAAHAERFEAMEVFREIYQPFIPPA
jgi:glutathione S-transferase